MVTVQVQSPDLDDRLTLESSTVQFFSPFFASSSFPAHGTLGTRAESGDRALGDMLDDFDVPAIAGGTVSALSGAIHLLCRSAFGRGSVSREELACSPVPGRNHDRVTAQLDGQASLRTVLQRPDPGRHHHRDDAQLDSQTSLLAVLHSPVPGRIQDRDAPQLDSHDPLLAVLRSPAADGGDSPLSGRTRIAGSPVSGRIQNADNQSSLPRATSLQSAASRLAIGPPIGGGTAIAQEAACTAIAQEAARIVQSHVRRIIARQHFVRVLDARERDTHQYHQALAAAARIVQTLVRRIIARRQFVDMIMESERAIYTRRLERVTCARAIQAMVRGVHARRRRVLMIMARERDTHEYHQVRAAAARIVQTLVRRIIMRMRRVIARRRLLARLSAVHVLQASTRRMTAHRQALPLAASGAPVTTAPDIGAGGALSALTALQLVTRGASVAFTPDTGVGGALSVLATASSELLLDWTHELLAARIGVYRTGTADDCPILFSNLLSCAALHNSSSLTTSAPNISVGGAENAQTAGERVKVYWADTQAAGERVKVYWADDDANQPQLWSAMVTHTLIGIQREPLAMDYDFNYGVYVLYHMIKHLLANF